MKRYNFTESEFEEHEQWEEEELEEHPDRADEDEVTDHTSMTLIDQIRERNLNKLKEEGIGYSKNPRKKDEQKKST